MGITLEHPSGVCLSVVNKMKRCKTCVKEYYRSQKPEQRKKNSEKQINTRSLFNDKENINMIMWCVTSVKEKY